MNTFLIRPTALTTGLLTALLLTGCGKNESPDGDPAKTSATTQSPPTTSPAAAATPADQYLQQAQAALQSRNYEQAALALTSAQRQPNLSAQQAEAVSTQMRLLQRSLASAVASGDPSAKAAADKLRQSATVR